MTRVRSKSKPPPAPTTELPFTGERFVPTQGGEICLKHMHRYA